MKQYFLTIVLILALGLSILNLFSLPVLADSAYCGSGKCHCNCSGADTCRYTSGDGECECYCGILRIDWCDGGHTNHPFHPNLNAILPWLY